MNKKSFIFTAIFLVLAVIIAAWFFIFKKPEKSGVSQLDVFAQCLSEKGAEMYGADWCPYCQNEKKAFGDAFRFISYIECPDNPKQCLAAAITGYPTWLFPDGKRFEGEQGLQNLSKESGCSLPEQ